MEEKQVGDQLALLINSFYTTVVYFFFHSLETHVGVMLSYQIYSTYW